MACPSIGILSCGNALDACGSWKLTLSIEVYNALRDIDLLEAYKAIDSVATGRIPSLFCAYVFIWAAGLYYSYIIQMEKIIVIIYCKLLWCNRVGKWNFPISPGLLRCNLTILAESSQSGWAIFVKKFFNFEDSPLDWQQLLTSFNYFWYVFISNLH